MRNDLTGKKFGMLTAIDIHSQAKNSTFKWNCKCDCGKSTIVFSSSLKSGSTKSCGCIRGKNITHGMTKTPTYISWKSMKARCSNPKNPDYSFYGARGIGFAANWKFFEIFLKDMGVRPIGLTLDRINNNEDYGPRNCK